jgi:hypothetical protein
VEIFQNFFSFGSSGLRDFPYSTGRPASFHSGKPSFNLTAR